MGTLYTQLCILCVLYYSRPGLFPLVQWIFAQNHRRCKQAQGYLPTFRLGKHAKGGDALNTLVVENVLYSCVCSESPPESEHYVSARTPCGSPVHSQLLEQRLLGYRCLAIFIESTKSKAIRASGQLLI